MNLLQYFALLSSHLWTGFQINTSGRCRKEQVPSMRGWGRSRRVPGPRRMKKGRGNENHRPSYRGCWDRERKGRQQPLRLPGRRGRGRISWLKCRRSPWWPLTLASPHWSLSADWAESYIAREQEGQSCQHENANQNRSEVWLCRAHSRVAVIAGLIACRLWSSIACTVP